MPKRKPQSGLPQVHENLKGYNLEIDAFGEVRSNISIECINDFLNSNANDKKIKKQVQSRGRKQANNDDVPNDDQ